MEAYERAAATILDGVRSLGEADLAEATDVYGEEWPRGHTLRVLIDHEIHHRGQIVTLMRRARLRPSSLYGPVAEDAGFDLDAFEDLRPCPIHPRIRVAWMIENGIWGVIFTGLAVAAELLWIPDWGWWPFGSWVGAGAVGVFTLLRTVVWPTLEWRAWSYVVRGHDVVLQHGVIWRVRRSVPRPRIQHVDVKSGPLDRAFGLAKCTLYTAGTGEEDATIPGLVHEQAEELRERLIGDAAS